MASLLHCGTNNTSHHITSGFCRNKDKKKAAEKRLQKSFLLLTKFFQCRLLCADCFRLILRRGLKVSGCEKRHDYHTLVQICTSSQRSLNNSISEVIKELQDQIRNINRSLSLMLCNNTGQIQRSLAITSESAA